MADGDPNGGVRYSTREMFDEIRRDIQGLRDEVRKGRHDLTSTIRAIELRLNNLENFKVDAAHRFAQNDDRAATWLPQLEHLLREESVAESMKKAGWTKRERLMAYGLVLFAFVGAVGTIVSLIVLINGGG